MERWYSTYPGVAMVNLLCKLATTQVVMYVGTASAGYLLPMLWLRHAISRRKEKLLDAFPDALDLMVVCVEAGLGLDAAISRVSAEIRFAHGELAEEFNLVSLELRTGLSRTEALKNLSRRIDLEEVGSLVALLVQTDKFGTSVGQALRVHSDAMRVNRQLRAEELAAKLPVKMLFPLVFFIFPSLFVVVIGPAAIRIARTLLPTLGGQARASQSGTASTGGSSHSIRRRQALARRHSEPAG